MRRACPPTKTRCAGRNKSAFRAEKVLPGFLRVAGWCASGHLPNRVEVFMCATAAMFAPRIFRRRSARRKCGHFFSDFLAAYHALHAANAKLRRCKNFARCEFLRHADGANAVFQKKLTDDCATE
jgi:hypothetical protein